ncbi:MAG: spermidine synthase [Marmoricola sp.]|jgi:spermidine synthase|nr:spermidine synthase [Marmoricola sp.]
MTEHAEVARAESERGELVLRRRSSPQAADVLELRVNGVFVMDTQETSSEEDMAALALDLVDQPRRVVVGGLGLGFTTRRVLADPRVEEVVVVEIEEALVGWMRDGTVPHGPALLADRRLRVVTADVATAIAEAQHPGTAYDLVLLDVDNGPGYLVHDVNARVYQHDLLTATRALLAPGGALVVWSAARSPELLATLRTVFGAAEEVVRPVGLQGRDEEYLLYLARA